jgi:hypothetical protein
LPLELPSPFGFAEPGAFRPRIHDATELVEAKRKASRKALDQHTFPDFPRGGKMTP